MLAHVKRIALWPALIGRRDPVGQVSAIQVGGLDVTKVVRTDKAPERQSAAR